MPRWLVEAPAWWRWLGDLVAAYGDKLVHGLLFMVLAPLWQRTLTAARGRATRGALVIASGLLYAGLLELAQTALGYRSGELGDVVADLCGMSLGLLLFPVK
jgi:VanZ family protein